MLIFFLQPLAHAQLSVTDVSPNDKFGSGLTHGVSTGGRVVSLVIDPNGVLYAAAELSGVWKSADGGQAWEWSSQGIRTGRTAYNGRTSLYALAVDATNSNRLMYAAMDDDGRLPCPTQAGTVNCSLGGLYVSGNAAGNWQRVSLPNCPAPQISSVVFVADRPFVATRCGIYTTAGTSLENSRWFAIASPFPPSSQVLLAAHSSTQTLFACASPGSKVYRAVAPALSSNPAIWTLGPDLGGNCLGLAASPAVFDKTGGAKVVVIHGTPNGQEVSVLDFNANSKSDLNFSSVAGSGSGVPTVLAVAGKTSGSLFTDVYAGDGLHFFFSRFDFLSSGAAASWQQLSPGTHDDTWAAAAPTTYDPVRGVCAVYVATDGGVYESNSMGPPPTSAPCDPSSNWAEAMSGLHAMYTGAIAGVDAACSSNLCPVLYLPTGDNDVWVTSGAFPDGARLWVPLGEPGCDQKSSLGDAGENLIDRALPDHVISTRGGCIELATSASSAPPNPISNQVSHTDITPLHVNTGIEVPGQHSVVQILTLPSDPQPTNGDYLTTRGTCPASKFAAPESSSRGDEILRKTNDQAGDAGWVDVSPTDHFGTCQVAALAASGGRTAPTIYVLTQTTAAPSTRAPGQLYKGTVHVRTGVVAAWRPASGTAPFSINEAVNFFVNPYNPKEIYAVDKGDQLIKFSNDGGGHFYEQSGLTSIATNDGEFRFGCAANGRNSLFANACALSGMAFDPNSGFRVAALYLGGVAISRDGGQHWIPLDVTNNVSRSGSQPPMQFPVSVFFDAQLNPATANPTIYVGLQGQSIVRVDGPFSTLASANMTYCAICNPTRPTGVIGVVDNLGTSFPLHRDADGFFRGRVLFDSAKFSTIRYHFVADGRPTATHTHTLSRAELRNGVLTLGSSTKGRPQRGRHKQRGAHH